MKKNIPATLITLAVLASLVFLSSCSHTAPAVVQQPPSQEILLQPIQPVQPQEKPYDPRVFVEDMLVSKGHKRSTVKSLLADERVKINPYVMVKNMFYAAPAPSPKNSKIMEVDPKYIYKGLDFIGDKWWVYEAAWEHYKVSPEVITAILIIESRLGTYPMKYNVFNVYASLTTLMDSEYLAATLQETKEKKKLTEEIITAARKKGNWGLGELSALISLSDKLGLDPRSIYGSYAGAIGYAQFIPTSYVKFGVDGNDDGKADPFDMEDCIASIANYLKLSGWKEDATLERKRKAIWNYNHHDVYVNTIMMLYDRLKAEGEGYYEEEGSEDGYEILPEGDVKADQGPGLPKAGCSGDSPGKTLQIPTASGAEDSGRSEGSK